MKHRLWQGDPHAILLPGLATGLVTQNGDPPYAVPNVEVLVHWLKDAPLRPANILAPGKVANTFAVESLTDELAALERTDPAAFRLRGLSDARGIEVLERAAALIGWQARRARQPRAEWAKASPIAITSTTKTTSPWPWTSKSSDLPARFACGASPAHTIAGW